MGPYLSSHVYGANEKYKIECRCLVEGKNYCLKILPGFTIGEFELFQQHLPKIEEEIGHQCKNNSKKGKAYISIHGASFTIHGASDNFVNKATETIKQYLEKMQTEQVRLTQRGLMNWFQSKEGVNKLDEIDRLSGTKSYLCDAPIRLLANVHCDPHLTRSYPFLNTMFLTWLKSDWRWIGKYKAVLDITTFVDDGIKGFLSNIKVCT